MKRIGMAAIVVLLALAAAVAPGMAKGSAPEPKEPAKKELTPEEAVKSIPKAAGTYAVIDTSKGRIICQIFEKEAPIGAANFIGLAEGTKEFTNPKTGRKEKKRFYDGLIFHRVIPGFMIQGGDPLGVGVGGPGYQFKNETSPGLKFDRPGRLAYANAGPDTNGSQFFITHKATPWLDGGYTIFGQAVAGQEVVDAIGNVPRGPNDKPTEPVYINKVTIVRVKAGKKK